MGLIPLQADEIHLWIANCEDMDEGSYRSMHLPLLSDSEREQQLRFRFARDRRRYLVTRGMVRTILSRYAPVAPADWQFAINTHGRPEVANREALERSIVFNISHTHEMIVLGVSRHRALGVDIENIAVRSTSMDIAQRYFAPQEVQELSLLECAEQRTRFFEYWTLKESYIKARGMGLAIPLDKFNFEFPYDGSIRLQIDPELADDPARWCFWQFALTPDCVVAVCAERTRLLPPRVVVKKMLPGPIGEVIAPRISRTSR